MRRNLVVLLSLVLLLWFVPVAQAVNTINFDPAKNNVGNTKSRLSSITNVYFLANSNDPVTITINIINSALAFLGVISLIFLLYAGVLWFKAGDNEEDITKAKEIIKGAIIGLVLSLSALAISTTIYTTILVPATETKTEQSPTTATS